MKTKDLILIVDDDLDILDLVSVWLRDEGYKVDNAKSGQEALEKSREKIYSLVLIDIKLSDIEDLRLLERMRDTDPKMRKVVVTRPGNLECARRAIDLGADAFLGKPFDKEKLLETVRRQLAERDKEFKERYVLLEDWV